MSEFLPPPDRSRFRSLRDGDVYRLKAPERLARVFATKGPYPTTWDAMREYGPLPSGRFDHQQPGSPGRGIWYGSVSKLAEGQPANAVTGALAEACADTHVVDRSARGRSLVILEPIRPLKLLRLDSSWLSAAQGNAAIASGPRNTAQEWSRAIYEHYPTIDGVYFRSSNHPPSGCVALYERAVDALVSASLLMRLDNPGLLPYLQDSCEDLGWPLA